MGEWGEKGACSQLEGTSLADKACNAQDMRDFIDFRPPTVTPNDASGPRYFRKLSGSEERRLGACRCVWVSCHAGKNREKPQVWDKRRIVLELGDATKTVAAGLGPINDALSDLSGIINLNPVTPEQRERLGSILTSFEDQTKEALAAISGIRELLQKK